MVEMIVANSITIRGIFLIRDYEMVREAKTCGAKLKRILVREYETIKMMRYISNGERIPSLYSYSIQFNLFMCKT
jgi:uncharacterized protein (UPF0248 family)